MRVHIQRAIDGEQAEQDLFDEVLQLLQKEMFEFANNTFPDWINWEVEPADISTSSGSSIIDPGPSARDKVISLSSIFLIHTCVLTSAVAQRNPSSNTNNRTLDAFKPATF